MVHSSLSALLLSAAAAQAVASQSSSESTSSSASHSGSDSSAWSSTNNYFNEFQNTLSLLQSKYFNGNYWPDALQWQTAVLDTFLGASDVSFTNALQEYNGNVPGTGSSASSIQALIKKYFSQTESFYGGEDVNQIYGAAYDDVQWVVLEQMENIKFINQYDAYAKSNLGQGDIAKFAHRAHIFYNVVQNKFDTSTCNGGITWNPTLSTYKNAITNELLISSSAKMYLYFPGDSNTDPYPSSSWQSQHGNLPPLPKLAAHDPLLLDNAKKEYAWFKTHNYTNSQGLIVDGFHISNGQTSCDQRNEMVYTYNQGVMLEGLRSLWEATGDASYLTDGYTYIRNTMAATGWAAPPSAKNQWQGLGRNGILEDFCDADGSCSNDGMLFKGIYFHNLAEFCEPLPTDTPLVPGVSKTASASLAQSHANECAGYAQWVYHNADGAIASRDSSGVIGGWWAGQSLNQAKPAAQYAAAKPQHSIDELNQAWVLLSAPWKCEGLHGCHGTFNPTKRSMLSRAASNMFKRATTQRTVQTQGSGLGVIKAASDFMYKRPAI